jgi:ribosomal protein S4
MDNLVYRMGYTPAAAARQLVLHGHFGQRRQGERAFLPAARGDVISVREESRNIPSSSHGRASSRDLPTGSSGTKT